MSEVSIVVSTTAPVSWTVEAIDDDGGIAVAMFSGSDAEANARRWAAIRYEQYFPEVIVK